MEADSKVPREMAEKEVQAWLDFKRVKSKKAEENSSSIETLIDGFQSGALVLEPETHNIKMKLEFHIGKDQKQLVFKPRLKVGEAHKKLKGVGASDVDGRILAYVAALTSMNSALIQDMDSEDYSIAQAIAIFFF